MRKGFLLLWDQALRALKEQIRNNFYSLVTIVSHYHCLSCVCLQSTLSARGVAILKTWKYCGGRTRFFLNFLFKNVKYIHKKKKNQMFSLPVKSKERKRNLWEKKLSLPALLNAGEGGDG